MAIGIHLQSNQSKILPEDVKKDIQRGTMQKVSVDVSWRVEQARRSRTGPAHRDVGFEHSL